jgi:hypothetical protein
MDDNGDYDFVPNVISNVTIPFENNHVFTDAVGIILAGVTAVAIIAIFAAALFVNHWLVLTITLIRGGTYKRDKEAGELAGISAGGNALICAIVIFFSAVFGFEDRGFTGSLWHALVVGLLILAFLLVIELVLIGLYWCANIDWSAKMKPAKKPATEAVEMEGLTSAAVQKDEAGDSKV